MGLRPAKVSEAAIVCFDYLLIFHIFDTRRHVACLFAHIDCYLIYRARARPRKPLALKAGVAYIGRTKRLGRPVVHASLRASRRDHRRVLRIIDLRLATLVGPSSRDSVLQEQVLRADYAAVVDLALLVGLRPQLVDLEVPPVLPVDHDEVSRRRCREEGPGEQEAWELTGVDEGHHELQEVYH